jgi:hypothetical protein
MLAILRQRQNEIQSDIRDLEEKIKEDQERIYQISLDLSAVEDAKHLSEESVEIQRELDEKRESLRERREKLTILASKQERFETLVAEVADGKMPSIRSHIQRAHRPQSKSALRLSRLAEVWTAVSTGITMITVVLLIGFARQFLLVGLGGLLLVMVTIEAAFKRRLSGLVRWIAILLVVSAFAILFVEFFWYIVLAVVMITGFYMIVENLRELSARR